MASGTLSHVSNFLFINEQTDEPPNRRNRIHHVSRSGASGSSQRLTTVTVERIWAGHVVA